LARELTERWHHQQQIRLAVNEPAEAPRDQPADDTRRPDAIMTPELYHPVLDCFMRALPFHYRTMPAPPGSSIRIHVSGECGGDWHLYRATEWLVSATSTGTPVATVTIPQEIAWRLFTKGIARDAAREQVHAAGDAALGDHVLN